MTELKLLNHEDWRIVKTIRLEKQFPVELLKALWGLR